MTDIREIMRDLVREYTLDDLIEAATRAALSQWNVQAACEHLQVSRPTMYSRMERYGIPRPTNHIPKLAMKPQANNLDVCYCGDYRKSHVDGVGACHVCVSGTTSSPHLGCKEFRLADRA